MSAPTQKEAKKIGAGQVDAADEVFLYEGGEVEKELKSKLTRVRIGPRVTCIPDGTFSRCRNLVDVQLNEGLLTIGAWAFYVCTALRSVALPSTVNTLGQYAFHGCRNLVKVQLNEGLEVVGERAFGECTALQSVSLPSTVIKLGDCAFFGCTNLVEVRLNEGLITVGRGTFANCALRSVTIPSTVTMLGLCAFLGCSNLLEVQLKDGLEVVGKCAFQDCTALRSVTIPSTVTSLGHGAFFGPSTVHLTFGGCTSLSEVILLGGQRLLNQEFLARRLTNDEEILNHEMIGVLIDGSTFRHCPLARVNISISWAVSERMARLSLEGRLSVEERIRNLPRLELMQDGNILACFPLVSGSEGDMLLDIEDTNNETSRSVYQVLQLIAYHELKESSILIELAMWKSGIDGERARADCRVAIPGPAKSFIRDYCGFTGFVRPAVDDA